MRRSEPDPPTVAELLASETRVRSVPEADGPLHVLMASPSAYAVAMGGLSFQAVWESFLATGMVDCDRAFCALPDGAAVVPERRFGSYDLIGFSLPWELEWLNVPAMLRAGGLSVWARERSDDDPVVIVGGASITMNPVPLSEMVDVFVIGEFEPIADRVVDALAEADGRGARLAALAAIPGLYVPSVEPGGPVERLRWDGVVDSPRSSLVVSEHSAFPGRFLIEAGRGCPMGCDFCLAGEIYGAVRFAAPETLLETARAGMAVTRRIGLIGSALSGFPRVDELVAELVDAGANVSLSSLRADKLTPLLLESLARGGQRTVTIAPEAAREPLRRSVGKSISDESLAQAIAAAGDAGVREVRLYFMTHLPGETEEDALAIADVVEHWTREHPKLRFAVTVSPFVPKPWTRLAGATFAARIDVRKRLESVAGELRRRTRVTVRSGSARWSSAQAALARGDERIGRAIAQASEDGGDYSALKRALKAEGINMDAPQQAPTEAPWVRALGELT